MTAKERATLRRLELENQQLREKVVRHIPPAERAPKASA